MNPELRRNLWLDATPRRLVFAVAIVAGVFAATWLLDRGRHAYAVTLAGAAVFAAVALAWAPRAARASVTREVRGGTWDFQRLSTLAPWALTWGKLAGATARSWALAAGGLSIAALQLASTSSLAHAAFWVVTALALAVTLQAAGLATGLVDVRRARASGRPLSARAPGLLLVAAALLTLLAMVWARQRIGTAAAWLHLGAGQPSSALPMAWFGRSYAPLPFACASLLACAGWALAWAWRTMRLELEGLNGPWAWLAFLACAGLYAWGFDPAKAAHPLAVRLAAAAWTWAALAYLAAFADPADKVRARQFATGFATRRPARVLSHLPLVAAPGLLAVCSGGVLAVVHLREGETAAALGVCAALALFVRDLGIIAWRRFAGRGGDAGVLVLLGALYLLGAGLGRLLGTARLAVLVWPSPQHPRLSLAVAAAAALLAWGLAALAIARPSPPPRRAPPAPIVPAPPSASSQAPSSPHVPSRTGADEPGDSAAPARPTSQADVAAVRDRPEPDPG